MASRRTTQDRFFKQAKAEGYAARSAYKLKEIQQKRQVIRRNDRVLDLGCAPGSWVQVASELVGPKGLVIGVDLKPVNVPLPPNAHTTVGDVFKLSADDLLRPAAPHHSPRPGPRTPDPDPSPPESPFRPPPPPAPPAPVSLFNVVLSDMAPSTEGGGGGTTDHFRSVDLCRRVLDLLPRLLRPGGHCVMKVFEGEAYPALLKDTARAFEEVKGFKPESSRDVSREMFIIALRFRPPAPPTRAAPTAQAPA